VIAIRKQRYMPDSPAPAEIRCTQCFRQNRKHLRNNSRPHLCSTCYREYRTERIKKEAGEVDDDSRWVCGEIVKPTLVEVHFGEDSESELRQLVAGDRVRVRLLAGESPVVELPDGGRAIVPKAVVRVLGAAQ
jgi:hypothetical protein